MNCQYCNKECKNANSLRNHERLCKNNPNRQENSRGMLGKKGNNQFSKAREEGKPIPKRSEETKQKLRIANIGRKHSEETKKKISKIRKKFLEENPDKVPYLLNHHSKGSSYPERYFKEVFDNHEVDYVYQHRVGLYSLDFAILDQKIDIEIDGSQHKCDARIVESDKIRTKTLKEQGWDVYRIYWPDYQKKTREEREQFIREFLVTLGV